MKIESKTVRATDNVAVLPISARKVANETGTVSAPTNDNVETDRPQIFLRRERRWARRAANG